MSEGMESNRENWIFSERTRRLVEDALAEDVGTGDYTTLWSVPAGHRSSARIIARAGGVLAGIPIARYLLTLMKPRPEVKSTLEDGASVTYEPGSVLCLERQEDGWALEWFVKPSMVPDV